MKLLLAVLAVVCAVSSASDVLDFKESDFDDGIKDKDIILVEFYAPWCGHCKKLAPEYEKAATRLKTNDPPVPLAKVDCTSEKSVCDRFGVQGFPTLKIFRKGAFSQEYEGPREADGIIKYMRGQSGPSSKELQTVEEFEKFIAGDDHSVIGFFETESKLKDSFLKVADTERDRYRFAHTSKPAILKKAGYNDDIVIYVPKNLQTKFEEAEIKYDGNYDTDKIKNFLVHDLPGLAGIRTTGNTYHFDQRPLVVVYYNVDYIKDPKGTNYWRNRVLKVAKEFKRKVHFAVSNKADFSHELDEYGLASKKESDKPLVAAQTDDGKFPMEDEFSPENLKKFVEDLLAGKLESYMKSEPIPDNNDGPVKVVVGRNFKEVVEDVDKDVLIEFYAPWCGHCKNLAPIYDELGEKMAGEDVVIAKMDATANDVPPKFNVRGFPTIYWVPKNNKKSPQPYNGGRQLDDFIKFIAKESTEGLNKFDRDGKKIKKKKEL